MTLPRILIIGANGAVGRSVLQQLLSLLQPPQIRVSTRNMATSNFPPAVEVVQGDLSDTASYPRLFTGVDRAFLYSTPEAPLAQLFSAAKDHGVQHITLLSSLAIESDPEGLIGTAQLKVESAIETSGLPYTFLRAGNFSSNTSLFWLPQVEKMGKIWMVYPHAKSAPVAEFDIAATAVVALTKDKLINQAVALTGPSCKTHQELIEAINRVRQREGKQPFNWDAVSPGAWKEKTAGFLPPDLQDQLLAFWEAGERELPVVQSSEAVTGKPSQSFDEWLECNKDTFLKY